MRSRIGVDITAHAQPYPPSGGTSSTFAAGSDAAAFSSSATGPSMSADEPLSAGPFSSLAGSADRAFPDDEASDESGPSRSPVWDAGAGMPAMLLALEQERAPK